MKKALSVILLISIILSFGIGTSASTTSTTSTEEEKPPFTPYEDRTVDINFTNLKLNIAEGNLVTILIYRKDGETPSEIVEGETAYAYTFTYNGENKVTANISADAAKTFKRGKFKIKITVSDGTTMGKIDTYDGEYTEYIYGDVDGDATIDTKDVMLLAKFLARYNMSFDKRNRAVSDVTHDGKISSDDLLKLVRCVAKWNIDLNPQS